LVQLGENVMKKRPEDLPDFSNPPLNEVAMSVEFVTEKPLRVIDIGVYWQKIKHDFPNYEEKPPLGPVDRSEKSFAQFDQPQIRFMSKLPPFSRCWFLNENGTKLIQVQQDRFIYNWRKLEGQELYPRYENVRDEFLALWQDFSDFLKGNGPGSPSIKAAELTYVNLIEKGSCWSEIKDVPKLFTFCNNQEVWKFLPDPEMFTCDLRFRISEKKARLNASLIPVLRTTDGNLAFRFTLSAQGATTEEDLFEWFQTSREWIVKGFTDLTTDTAHTFWKRNK